MRVADGGDQLLVELGVGGELLGQCDDRRIVFCVSNGRRVVETSVVGRRVGGRFDVTGGLEVGEAVAEGGNRGLQVSTILLILNRPPLTATLSDTSITNSGTKVLVIMSRVVESRDV